VVRSATVADASAISCVRTRTWQFAYAHIFPPERLDAAPDGQATEWVERSIRDPWPHMHTLVAERARRVVGFAGLGESREEEGAGELYAIYVLPEESGAGIGQALMQETLRRMRGEGFDEAVLWVLENNPRTRRFYELAGWQPDGGTKDEELLDTMVREVRYRIGLAPVR
jgi:ribosomal protein S18 acetylase RimI-like enzyme